MIKVVLGFVAGVVVILGIGVASLNDADWACIETEIGSLEEATCKAEYYINNK